MEYFDQMIKPKFTTKFFIRIQFLSFLVIEILMTSCGFTNRMTSPQVLEKSERIWNFGIVYEPTAAENYDDGILGIQPIFGYRSGLGKNQEIGITLYGVYLPGLVIDHKLKYYEKSNFILTGDIAAFGGLIRPIGLQYDLLFGNREVYGVFGLKYDFFPILNNEPSWIIGVGNKIDKKNSRFLFQLTYSNSFPEYNKLSEKQRPFKEITIGLKYCIINTKKKYR